MYNGVQGTYRDGKIELNEQPKGAAEGMQVLVIFPSPGNAEAREGRIDTAPPEAFRTLRGFLTGYETDEATYFEYSATLRVHGEGVPFAELTERLGVQPTHLHRKGEIHGSRSPVAWRDDAWHYEPPLPETEPLECHINALWAVVRPHAEYIKALKQRFKVDVSCGYISNCDSAGVVVPHTCLEMFTSLEVPFGLSIIVS